MSDRAKRAGPGSAADRQRVFVALWPTPEVRARLRVVSDDLARRAAKARQVEAANLHLTLAFIGSLEAELVPELSTRVHSCRSDGFDWVIDRAGHFEGARVVWAGGPPCAPLVDLARRTRAMLDLMHIGYDRKPFAPHVTVLRDVARWPAGEFRISPEIAWPCKGPTLVRSEPGPAGVAYVPVTARSGSC